ncbi:MAG: family 43 glycosylhydrolase [Clostridia bacterium]|nr:family 43 glycosylhydrolase [Clostridia bacterium]
MTESYKKSGENNPLYTQRFGADPGAMEYNGRIYVYMTDDIIEFDANGKVRENSYSKIRCINCISSDDMVNWTDHGRINVAGPNGAAKWATNSWAPCAAHKVIDGKEKFFLYFCNGGNGIGVLTADSPTGPWQDELGHGLITRATPNCANVTWLFDPAVMVDDDGTGYLAFGGGIPDGKVDFPGTSRVVRLGQDMISLDCEPVSMTVPYLFEDSGLNKINGQYVYTYCSNFQANGNKFGITNGAIEYMVADDPLGPYHFVGELFPNEGNFFGLWGNNHHSIANIGNSWFLFYHNRPVEKAMGITGNYRSPQVDRIIINNDGKLQKVRGTMTGIPQLKELDPFTAAVSACTMSNQAGIDTNGQFVTDIDTGDWIKVSGVDFGDGASILRIKAKADERLSIRVCADDPQSEPLTTAVFTPATKEARRRVTVSGKHDLYFIFEGSGTFESWQAFNSADDIDEAIRQENGGYTDSVPAAYLAPCTVQGTIEKITYTARDWFGGGDTYEKNAFVYLPHGYDPNGSYDVLILCHGIGGSEYEWGMTDIASSKVACMMDHLIENGEVPPMIVVTPNGRAGHSDDFNTFYRFGQELREDLLPWLDEHYATYGNDRDHRFMAGLSMGGMQTINIGIGECLDLFSAFGAFSACPTTNPSSITASALNKSADLPVHLFYNICGTEDNVALASATAAVKDITASTGALNDNNFVWQTVPGGHDFGVWYLGFFNFVRMLADK